VQLLAEWRVTEPPQERRIQLLQGDLASIPAEHAVDLLIVSAFPHDYTETPSSLIGALAAGGLSVRRLAQDKALDLRQHYSCWLSKPVPPAFHAARVLCVESGWKGTAAEMTDDIFRAMAAQLLAEVRAVSVAMPVIGTGDQGRPLAEMLETILAATFGWMRRGLPLGLLKIVVHNPAQADRARTVFVAERRRLTPAAAPVQAAPGYDVFVSYAREEAPLADLMLRTLRDQGRPLRVFSDRESLRGGAAWAMELARALDASRRVVALYSPNYWRSKVCQMEFLAALARHFQEERDVLFPIYLSDAAIPSMFLALQYEDCRVNDKAKLRDACGRLLAALN
jgi:hypothetical protein